MNFTESSAFQTESGTTFYGKYIAGSISSFPWGPKPDQNAGKMAEFVNVDLLHIYIIKEIEMIQPVYEGNKLANPESVSITYAVSPNEWLVYKNSSGNMVFFKNYHSLLMMICSVEIDF